MQDKPNFVIITRLATLNDIKDIALLIIDMAKSSENKTLDYEDTCNKFKEILSNDLGYNFCVAQYKDEIVGIFSFSTEVNVFTGKNMFWAGSFVINSKYRR